MSIHKLQQQKKEIEAQIAQAEFAIKNQPKVEKLVLQLLQKHPDIFLCDLTAIKNNLSPVLANIARNPDYRQQQMASSSTAC
jgi:23S rRNA maturation-related 3'-5' exoribonuclease YhaM